jgi:membrane fusion protein (multidrug efflux system)
VTLPQTAISYNPYGSTVFIAEQDKGPDGKTALVAHQVFVATGQTRGDQVAILKGVAPGDTVVVAGQVKLHNGTPIAVNNTVLPTDAANPIPVEQ